MNILDIKEIFAGQFEARKPMIKSIYVDAVAHKRGIINIAKYYQPDYDIAVNGLKSLFNDLFLYFIGSEDSTLNLSKGILLVGNPGSGKTLIMTIFKNYAIYNGVNTFQFHDVKTLVKDAEINGIKAIEKFGTTNDYPITCLLDDIGAKNESVNNYGTTFNVVDELISMRYLVYTKCRKLTHFTSNIYPAEIETLYGARAASRLAEMCNIIELTGIDFRKK